VLRRAPGERPKIFFTYGRGEPGQIDVACEEMVRLLASDFGYRWGRGGDGEVFIYRDEVGTHNETAWEYLFQVFFKTYYLGDSDKPKE